MRPTDKDVVHHKKIGYSFRVPGELVQDFSLVSEAPLNNDAILKASKDSLFGEAGRDYFIAYLCLLLFILNHLDCTFFYYFPST